MLSTLSPKASGALDAVDESVESIDIFKSSRHYRRYRPQLSLYSPKLSILDTVFYSMESMENPFRLFQEHGELSMLMARALDTFARLSDATHTLGSLSAIALSAPVIEIIDTCRQHRELSVVLVRALRTIESNRCSGRDLPARRSEHATRTRQGTLSMLDMEHEVIHHHKRAKIQA